MQRVCPRRGQSAIRALMTDAGVTTIVYRLGNCLLKNKLSHCGGGVVLMVLDTKRMNHSLRVKGILRVPLFVNGVELVVKRLRRGEA